MNSLKKLSMVATVLGLGATSSFAEIKLTDNLGVAGFLDMSALGVIPDTGDATLNANVDQLELDFMFKFGDKISGRIDVAQGGAGGNVGNLGLEQGFVSYSNNGAGFSVGRFLSSSGFESAEPTGLYQYSISKTTGVYGGYQNGVNASYVTPMFGLYGAIVTDLWSAAETDLNTPGFEAQVALTPAEGVTAKVAYLYQMQDDEAVATLDDASKQLFNVWGSYAKGPITAAVEYNLLIDWVVPDGAGVVNDGMGHGYLAMVNYKLTDVVAATLRYSGLMLGDADPDTEVTFSPSLAISPNWLALAEVKYHIDASVTEYAVESLFSF